MPNYSQNSAIRPEKHNVTSDKQHFNDMPLINPWTKQKKYGPAIVYLLANITYFD